MRTYPPSFAYANNASEKRPRFIVGILFDTESLYFTSHDGITNVPGLITEAVLTVEDAVSQRIVPDEGRSEIGIVNFSLLDRSREVTDIFREKDVDALGLRGRTVQLLHGWDGADFEQFQVFQTQVIASVTYDKGRYSIKCADITRELRKEIFDPKIARLSASISATAVTIPVYSTNGFEMIEHGDSYGDAPNATVGYIKIEDEKIRYTGTTSTSFTGCTRGVLNTRAVSHNVDVATPEDQSTEVKEVIYLEMPAVKLILAILTGELYDQSSQYLPDHWHLGIDPIWVRTADFTSIGADLWNLTSDAISFVPRFLSMKKVDGKKFLESEVYQLIGCYPLIYSDGTIGIRRMNRILADSPFVAALDDSNVESWGGLEYDMESIANDYLVQWNFNDDDVPTRITRLVDGNSIDKHGRAQQRILKFRGLYGSRHTYTTVRARLDSMRDRYASPPALQNVSAMPRMNILEVGDVVRNRLPLVRDFMGSGASIDRSMEVQRVRINLTTGDVELELFGSTDVASTNQPDGDGTTTPGSGGEGPDGDNNLPDDFYTQVGTPLSSVVDMTLIGDVWVVDAGSYNVPGNADATNPGAIYYHVGDLTIPDGAVINITQNVQLRVAGFFTVNGDILGIGAGNAGVADPVGYGTVATGVSGFGSSRAMDGIATKVVGKSGRQYLTLAPPTTSGLLSQVPNYTITINSDNSPPDLDGLPSDLRGTSGGPGGKITWMLDSKLVLAAGGSGADGGAGLIMISRGLSIGASGVIDLSGDDSSTPTTYDDTLIGFNSQTRQYVKPGAGAPGCPGALLILLDGPDLPLPDLSAGRFLAITGNSGAPQLNTMTSIAGGTNPWNTKSNVIPWEGYLDPTLTDEEDMSNAAYRIQYLPRVQSPLEDQPSAVPPPDNLVATGIPNGISLSWDSPPFDQFDAVEIYVAPTNDRTGAVKLTEVKASSYTASYAPGITRYFWLRNRKGAQVSTYEQPSPTGGTSATST